MKKVLFGIFAHPDDEAFGPSGTLYKMTQSGIDVHLICATAGENGVNCDNVPNLAEIRLKEWHEAGKLIGSASNFHLGYEDGTLNNNAFHELAGMVEAFIARTIESYHNEPLQISFLTFDANGITGHIDHITMSMVANYVYHRLKAEPPTNCALVELRHFCIDHKTQPEADVHYLFMPQGHAKRGIDITEDISDVADQKRATMCAHYSQRKDAETILGMSSTLKYECFYTVK